MAGKTGENLLNILGTVGDVFGKVLLGPDAGNIDLGAPFKMGAALERQKREENALMEVLKGNPHTAPIVEMGRHLADNGGALNGIRDEFGGPMPQTTYTPPDIQSPQFISDYLAKGGSGETAAAFLGNQINNRQAESNPIKEQLQNLLLVRQLGEPSKKELADDEFKRRKELAELYGEIAKGKTEAAQTGSHVNKLSDSMQKPLNAIDANQQAIDQLLGRIDSGQWPSTLTAAISSIPGGNFFLQHSGSSDDLAILEQLNTMKEQSKNIISQVKEASGLAASDAERKYIIGANVSKFDTKEAAKVFLTQAYNRNQFGRLLITYNTALAAGDKDSGIEIFQRAGYSPDQAIAFAKYRQIVNTGKDPMKTKEGLALAQILGFKQ